MSRNLSTAHYYKDDLESFHIAANLLWVETIMRSRNLSMVHYYKDDLELFHVVVILFLSHMSRTPTYVHKNKEIFWVISYCCQLIKTHL